MPQNVTKFRVNITNLKVSDGELKNITGVNVADIGMEYIGTVIAGIIGGTMLLVPVGFLTALLLRILPGLEVGFWLTIKTAAVLSYLPVMWWGIRNIRKSGHIRKRLKPLLQEVKNYNQLVSHINTIDQLAKAGNPVQVEDRETVVKGIQTMREQLVRALKTERILRENPGFQSSEFSLDLAPLYVLEVQQQATEYHNVLQNTLQIGRNVQQEVVNLYKTSD